MPNIEIGEVKEFEGKRYTCVKNSGSCDCCAFDRELLSVCQRVWDNLGDCTGNVREDGNHVVFQRVADDVE